jgi:arsenate reductase-like glutaredoxin family protein
LGADDIRIVEQVSASKKLGADAAGELLDDASRLIAAKGRKVQAFDLKKDDRADALAAMLGPTGNLRAPTLKRGKTLVVGFHEETYADLFG